MLPTPSSVAKLLVVRSGIYNAKWLRKLVSFLVGISIFLGLLAWGLASCSGPSQRASTARGGVSQANNSLPPFCSGSADVRLEDSNKVTIKPDRCLSEAITVPNWAQVTSEGPHGMIVWDCSININDPRDCRATFALRREYTGKLIYPGLFRVQGIPGGEFTITLNNPRAKKKGV